MQTIESHWEDEENNRRVAFSVGYTRQAHPAADTDHRSAEGQHEEREPHEAEVGEDLQRHAVRLADGSRILAKAFARELEGSGSGTTERFVGGDPEHTRRDERASDGVLSLRHEPGDGEAPAGERDDERSGEHERGEGATVGDAVCAERPVLDERGARERPAPDDECWKPGHERKKTVG